MVEIVVMMNMKGKNAMKKDINQEDKIKQIIILCSHNIKGLISKEIVEQYLPIQIQDLKIYEEGNKIIFEKEKMKFTYILADGNYYSNIEILKNLTPIYNIEYKGDDILNLIKYRNKIILMLSERGEIK